ncbi:HlyD family efflux transporter periplasmic adaptor subunit [Sphingobacterium siyangense]|uniref:HlyD family efflux transporter periplasmic adaptor subunit n=1 Tax=Sphingobacterium siyangense TaxID=459529 RepID=UPI0028B0B46E|nr:HlyD family efflux transporter periplasmic adaptor subunit [Sphingobacterium siyangense]
MDVQEKEIKYQRTEEVRDIISNMPTAFARTIVYLVLLMVGLLLIFGYIVKYPDIVSGEVTVSAQNAPVQIVSPQSGRLRLRAFKSQDRVNSKDILAWVENTVDPEQVIYIRGYVDSLKLPFTNAREIYNLLPKNLKLGDLTVPYSTFLSSLRQLADYQEHKLYDKQDLSLSKVLNEQNIALNTLQEKERLSKENLKLSDKFLKRDSILFSKRLISEAEYEESLAGHLTAEDQVKSSLRNSGSVREAISNTENTMQQNRITKTEKELQLDLDLLTSYNNLIDKINIWEKKYLIVSPIYGHAQFLKFWTDNQFIQEGEPIFSIIPKEGKTIGKVMLPIQGAGKVKVGQRAIIKLADYPYMEYGYIEAEVQNIALVSSIVKAGNGTSVESYLVTLIFPNGLKTNYGTSLAFRFEAKGLVEIVTKERRLIERFFDNLKYIGYTK